MAERAAFCRLCLGYCGIRVTVEDGRAVKVIGDVKNPVTEGFTCIKGRSIPEQLRHRDRLLGARKGNRDGSFSPIGLDDALNEISERFRHILDRHGPRSVALYTGTGSAGYPASALGVAFWKAIGSPMVFSPSTIDQPGKQVAASLHGRWSGSAWSPAEADVWMFVGTNPLLTMWAGTPMYNPAKQLREGKRRGMRIIVVDPRRTELAGFADIHLRPRPGEDPTLLAGLIRILLDQHAHDTEFCNRHVGGIDELRAAVSPFHPGYVAARTGVLESQLHETVSILSSSSRGGVTAGTGPNMAPRGLLSEYLLLCLHTLCGFWRRAGDPVPNPGVLVPPRQFKAQAEAGQPAWGSGEKMRVRDLAQTSAGLPTAALADEMLLGGAGQVKALINLGGNPAVAWPDQLKTVSGLRELDLLVSLDIRMSATSRLSDYILGTKFHLEIPEVTLSDSIRGYGAACNGFPIPFAMYAPAVVDAPPGSELIEEWELFYGMAQRLGVALSLNGIGLDMQVKPTTDDIYDLLTTGSRIPLAEVRRFERGHIFTGEKVMVEPADADLLDDWRLRVGDPVMLTQLNEVAVEPPADNEAYPFRLIPRRMREMKNSYGMDTHALTNWPRFNPAYMHPDDLTKLGLESGDAVDIRSSRATIVGIVEGDDSVLPGCVSMTHCWGDLPGRDAEFETIGSNTSRLIDSATNFDRITGMPRMSAVPVTVTTHISATD